MSSPTPPYTEEQLAGDTVSKKDLVSTLQQLASTEFLVEHKVKGAVKNVVKTKTKEQLVADYKELFERKAFKKEGDEEKEEQKRKEEMEHVTEKTKKLDVKDEPQERPRFKKRIIKKGNKINYPAKGDTVLCYYTGKLADGTVFDTNAETRLGKKGMKNQPLKFKVGAGLVIRGWDEGIQTMSLGEKSEIVIEAEWAYGRKGIEGKIPPNATLTFEIELTAIE